MSEVRIVVVGGYGRVGKCLARAFGYGEYKPHGGRNFLEGASLALVGRKGIHTVAEAIALDSVHGPFRRPISIEGDLLRVGAASFRYYKAEIGEDEVTLPPYDGKTIIVDATGITKDRAKNFSGIEGLKGDAVVVTNPLKGADLTAVVGVNHTEIQRVSLMPRAVIATGSCSTNYAVPIIQEMEENYEVLDIDYALTVHSATGSNVTVDKVLGKGGTEDARGRAAMNGFHAASTGLAKAAAPALPHMKGRLGPAMAVRGPVADGSLLFILASVAAKSGGPEVSAIAINEVMRRASEYGQRAGIIGFTAYPTYVSQDVVNDVHSGVVMGPWTEVTESAVLRKLEELGGPSAKRVRLLGAYDNEFGVPHRAFDIANYLAGYWSGNLTG